MFYLAFGCMLLTVAYSHVWWGYLPLPSLTLWHLSKSQDGDRLQYKLLDGDGPLTGWISLTTQGRQLVVLSEKVWIACGGLEKGGLLVREGSELTSSLMPDRLGTGAVVTELDPIADGRLHYKLLSGNGPATGWVTVAAQGKELMRRTQERPSPSPGLQTDRKMSKIRILALAGSLTCKEMIKFQCGPLAAALGKDVAEWTFAEGTVAHPFDVASKSLTDFERLVAGKRQQISSWYIDIYHCEKERSVTEKQFDKEVDVESVAISDKVAELRQRVQEEGPFDVALGFSQGCIMMHFLMGHLWQEGIAPPWKLSLFFEGMHIRDHRYAHLFEKPLDHRSIHIIGKASPYYAYAREGWCSKTKVEDYYLNPVVLTHEEGHCFPTMQPRAKEIYEILRKEIKATMEN
ncbi:unnamed protein product [Durusdinium trenchii]|uniref:Serine hydrolase domain-containing protein n=2 Tax=Durusdinium trenchii TaxID=1381693 RepID=A0ABP0IE25_9DINO